MIDSSLTIVLVTTCPVFDLIVVFSSLFLLIIFAENSIWGTILFSLFSLAHLIVTLVAFPMVGLMNMALYFSFILALICHLLRTLPEGMYMVSKTLDQCMIYLFLFAAIICLLASGILGYLAWNEWRDSFGH